MSRWAISFSIAAALSVVVGCAPNVESLPTTTSPAPPEGAELQLSFDVDSWSGEVEWALVEECALLGLSDCAVRVEALKVGDCTVAAARSILEALAGSTGLDPSTTLDTFLSRGDCSEIDPRAWYVTTQ